MSDVVLFADVVDGGNPRELLYPANRYRVILELEQPAELLVG